MANVRAGEQARNGKRRILIVEDELVNQAILSHILQDEYDISVADTGENAIQMITQERNPFSLVLLDLILPDINGMDILRKLREDALLTHFPVIVMTSDKEAEVQCLTLGAIDFIPKPYPMPEVIRARVQRTIELYEDKNIIQRTECDHLTGLYNREFFFRYAEQRDQFHPDVPMDALVIDVNHFHMIVERYGKNYGDEILKRIGASVNELAQTTGGIACRYEADIFMVYCNHQDDYTSLLEDASKVLTENKDDNSRVRLRMGVYSDVDKAIEVERRFDRAKNACNTIRNSFNNSIAMYDSALHEAEVFAEQLLEDFHEAIDRHQFLVYYQPKFDIRQDQPRLSSAEALVRWNHPVYGMISPGVFIPLFENNGLIPELDRYVWREAAMQIHAWKEQLGIAVPVSVNVSRIDMLNPLLVDTMKDLIEEFDLTADEFLLEITESAYTQESEQIVETINKLRGLGFRIEMDDFGVGYSSLNMISTLPIDALKLDMMFIRSAFEEKKDTRIIEVIIEIASYLSVPVIAEGVETENQVQVLRQMGCDIVQGYYFSKPVPAEQFERFLLNLRDSMEEAPQQSEIPDLPATDAEPRTASAAEALIPSQTETEDESGERKRAIPLSIASFIFIIVALLVSIALFVTDAKVTGGYQEMEWASEQYIKAQQAATTLEITSDYMTDQARCFIVTGDIRYLNSFFREVEETKRRDTAVYELETLVHGSHQDAYAQLNQALNMSNELIGYEHQAMKLRLSTGNYPEEQVPSALKELTLTPEQTALTQEEKIAQAIELVYGKAYMDYKSRIKESIDQCTQTLIAASDSALRQSSDRMNSLLLLQTILTMVMLLVILLMVVFISAWVRKPLTRMVKLMKEKKTVPPVGAEELQFVSQTYNEIFRENEKANARLTYEAMHDTLTGLYNQNGYDVLRHSVDLSNVALLIVGVNGFKTVIEQYGREVGDQVIRHVAELLQRAFRSIDLIFRIGSDEFVIIMVRANSSMRELIEAKVEQSNVMLLYPKNELPPVSLSVGVAFSDRENPKGDLFQDADSALKKVRESGHPGCVIF